jgi:uncharacterized protein (DUF1330 family)
MPKGYWIVRLDVADPEGYKAYVAANAEPLSHYGARFLVRGGRNVVKEGSGRARNVVVEFPSYEAALACYESDSYQRALALRLPHATADLTIVEGFEPS